MGHVLQNPAGAGGTGLDRQITRRSELPLIIINRSLEVLFYSETNGDGSERFFEDGRLTPKLKDIVSNILRGASKSPAFLSTTTAPWFVKVRILVGSNALREASGDCYAVTIETLRNRDQLAEARRRFSLTRRESDVLFEILRGASVAEIATTLYLAEGTVQGYYKRLLQRTNARNRAAMIALVLGWDGPIAVRSQ